MNKGLGQATLENVVLIGLVVAAIIGASVYLSRGFQGRLREQADQVGEQYSPKGMNTYMVETSDYSRNESKYTPDEAAKQSTAESWKDATITIEGDENVIRVLKDEPWR